MDDISRDVILILGLLVGVVALLSPWHWGASPDDDASPEPDRDAAAQRPVQR